MAKRKKDKAKAIPLDPFEEIDDHRAKLGDAMTSAVGPSKEGLEESPALESKITPAQKKTKEKPKKKVATKSTAKKKSKEATGEKLKGTEVTLKQEIEDQQIVERAVDGHQDIGADQIQIEQGAGDPLDELMAIIEGDERSTELEAMLAGVLPEPLETIPTEQHVVFILEDNEYAIPIDNVLEIGQPLKPTALPFVPAWLQGVANLRGEIVSIVDLRTLLDLPASKITHTHRFMIVRTLKDDMRMGLIVDRVLGSHHLVVEHIREVKELHDDPLGEFVHAIYDHGGRSLIVLDFDLFLRSAELQQFKVI